MEKSKKGLFGIFAGKKATVTPSSHSGNDSSSDLPLCPSNGPRSPLVDETAQGHGLVGAMSLRSRNETTKCKGKNDAEDESNDESSSPIWRSGAPLVQRRFSQSNVSDGRQRMIAAEYRAKMEDAFDDLIRNRRLALTNDVASH